MIPPILDTIRLQGGPLRKRGCQVGSSPSLFDVGWLWRNRHERTVLHLNWHPPLYFLETRFRTARALVAYAARLIVARFLGYRILWRVHNHQDHEGRYPILDRIGGWLTYHVAHVVAVFSKWAKGEVARHYGRRDRVRVIGVGPYTPQYRVCNDRAQVRGRQGWGPSHCVFLLFGDLRSNKGVSAALRAFRQLPHAPAALWVVGRPRDVEVCREIEAASKSDPRIRFRFEYIPDEEVGETIAASDVVLLPYESVLNSGVLHLAGDFGRYVVAPDIGLFREMIRGRRRRFFKPGSVGSLRRAMETAFRTAKDLPGDGASEVLRYDSWDESARLLIRAYRGEPEWD